jgi:hypothetical protein
MYKIRISLFLFSILPQNLLSFVLRLTNFVDVVLSLLALLNSGFGQFNLLHFVLRSRWNCGDVRNDLLMLHFRLFWLFSCLLGRIALIFLVYLVDYFVYAFHFGLMRVARAWVIFLSLECVLFWLLEVAGDLLRIFWGIIWILGLIGVWTWSHILGVVLIGGIYLILELVLGRSSTFLRS